MASEAQAPSGHARWIDSLAGSLSPTVRAIEARRGELLRQLATLPRRAVGQQSASLGFHSSYAPSAWKARWVQVDLGKTLPIDGLALIPARADSGGRSESGYGFPLRFRIEIANDPGFETAQTVADQTEADLPNPGDYPYYVSTPGCRGRYVRVTAIKLRQDRSFWLFALGELSVLSGGRNIAAGRAVRVNPRAMVIPPAWVKENLVDSQSVLGTPVEVEESSTNGYSSASASSPDETKWVQVDLRRRVPIDEIRLIPARPKIAPDFVGYAFPVRFRVDVADDPDCTKPVNVVDHTGADFPNPGDNPVVVPADGHSARFVRVTVTRLWQRDFGYFFALAELQVISEGKNVALGCPVTALDCYPSSRERWDPKYLVDGFNSRNRLADWQGWLSGLARRHELETSLRELDREREQAVGGFGAQLLSWSGVGAATLGLAVLLAGYRSRAARKREVERLRNQIASDLHDEIGSNLGSIALLSQLALTHTAGDQDARQEFGEINRIAQQTVESMRDIVWFINPDCAGRADLYARMREVAATLLSGAPYTFESPENPARGELSLAFRRHVFLFFKEALHNVVKHARATQVDILVTEERGRFHLRIRDNGIGFDVSSVRAGNGLKSLRQRAASLKGTLAIDSRSGQGTTIALTAELT